MLYHKKHHARGGPVNAFRPARCAHGVMREFRSRAWKKPYVGTCSAWIEGKARRHLATQRRSSSSLAFGVLAWVGAVWFALPVGAQSRPAPGTFLPTDAPPYKPPAEAAPKQHRPVRPRQNDPRLRFYLEVGGSLSGRASYSGSGGGLPRTMNDSADPERVKPSGDVRLGATLPFNRWFALDIAGGHTGLQTRYFESYGRSERSHVVNLRAGPMLRLMPGRRRASPTFFTSVTAGPSWAFISSEVAHVRVEGVTSPKTRFVVAWSLGMEIPLIPDAFGLRLQANYEWLRADYTSELETFSEVLSRDTLAVSVRRTVGLFGIWVQL